MYTEIRHADTVFKFTTQQYVVGLYAVVYMQKDGDERDTLISQQGHRMPELKYHQQLRRKAVKQGDIVTENSTPIEDLRTCRKRKNNNPK